MPQAHCSNAALRFRANLKTHETAKQLKTKVAEDAIQRAVVHLVCAFYASALLSLLRALLILGNSCRPMVRKGRPACMKQEFKQVGWSCRMYPLILSAISFAGVAVVFSHTYPQPLAGRSPSTTRPNPFESAGGVKIHLPPRDARQATEGLAGDSLFQADNCKGASSLNTSPGFHLQMFLRQLHKHAVMSNTKQTAQRSAIGSPICYGALKGL